MKEIEGVLLNSNLSSQFSGTKKYKEVTFKNQKQYIQFLSIKNKILGIGIQW